MAWGDIQKKRVAEVVNVPVKEEEIEEVEEDEEEEVEEDEEEESDEEKEENEEKEPEELTKPFDLQGFILRIIAALLVLLIYFIITS